MKKFHVDTLTIQTDSAQRGVFWVIEDKGEEHLLAFSFISGAVTCVAKSGNTYNHKKLWEHVSRYYQCFHDEGWQEDF